MSYTNVYPTRINWENEPSISSPINATNLNKIDYAVYQHDRTLETWDTTKANQSDLLLSVKSIDYDTDTGVFVFTWQNGTTKTVDLNIEKIPVSFSMSPQGVITMTTDDGTQYTADVGALIKTYTFTDSSVIDFTVTTDASGNKTVTADIVDGSITGSKLQPNYLADCQSAANSASGSATAADGSAEDSEAWAVGERGGVPVPSTDPAYENNAKWYAEHGTGNSLVGLTDTDITSPTDGQALIYDSASTKWKNKNVLTGSTVTVATTESTLYGEDITLTFGGTYIRTATFNAYGIAVFQGVTVTGTVTLTTSDGSQTATRTLDMPYFGNYIMTITFFEATITVTYPANGTCTISDGVTTLTANQNPMAFSIPNAGTWTAKATVDGVEKSGTPITITTSGQTVTDTILFGTINLTYDSEFRGLTLTCNDGVTTISKLAPSTGNTMAFYPPNTGTWTISGTYSGTPYSVDAEVSDLSVAVSAQLRTYVVATVTIHGAVEATITYVDVSGVHTQVLDSNGEKANVTITCLPTNPYVTFVDSDKSKVPEKLDEPYFRRYEITSATTDIYVVPENSLYWYGYVDSNCEPMNTANGWSNTNGYTFGSFTYNKNSATYTAPMNYIGGIVSKSTLSSSNVVKCIAKMTSSTDFGARVGYNTSKSFTVQNTPTELSDITSTSLEVVSKNAVNNSYAVFETHNTRGCELDGFWYEPTHTTPTYYSAACDVLYIKDSSDNIIPIAYTDSEGKCYDAISLPNGTYTFYSSVAKNPDNLSESYSKSVTITSATTEIRVMPTNTLYWYGYMDSNLEECSTANGWTAASGYSFTSPTYNKNYIGLVGATNKHCGVGSKTTTNGKLNAITQGLTAAINVYGEVGRDNIKNVGTGTIVTKQVTSSSLSKVTEDTTQSENYYNFAMATNARSFNLYALWYE